MVSWTNRRRNDGTAITTRMMTGITVQATSSSVLCVVFDGVGLAFALNFTMMMSSSASTKSVIDGDDRAGSRGTRRCRPSSATPIAGSPAARARAGRGRQAPRRASAARCSDGRGKRSDQSLAPALACPLLHKSAVGRRVLASRGRDCACPSRARALARHRSPAEASALGDSAGKFPASQTTIQPHSQCASARSRDATIRRSQQRPDCRRISPTGRALRRS